MKNIILKWKAVMDGDACLWGVAQIFRDYDSCIIIWNEKWHVQQ
jgi:hypothetical protein